MSRFTQSDRPSERGFTFIEVLVVMGIIAVLAGLTMGALKLMGRKKPEIATQTRIQKVSGAVNAWHMRFQRWPPMDPRKIQKVAGGSKSIRALENETNQGIESLVQALYWETAGLDVQLDGESDMGNTDEDALSSAVTNQGPMLWEVLDGWGNPLVYFVHTQYVKMSENPLPYVLGENRDGDEVTPVPWKQEGEGRTGFAQAQSFQVFSMGPDGEPNTPDDIKSW